ncbi:RHS repeat-associated core domain-containing protein [Chitiniphilus shinanonensis]|uniref:RHS repeat-associated core domain-containing protein n=1 Tax=Chitiniphilus shinanonensis TaxID=553088 RepID=UPI0030389EDC
MVAYYHRNHLDTPLQATDKTGRVVWAANYNAFGRASITTPTATAEAPTITSHLRLPGQYEDDETGWYYNYHRYYEPDLGRYTTRDPIGLAGGINVYGYAEAEPLVGRDPLGLSRYRPVTTNQTARLYGNNLTVQIYLRQIREIDPAFRYEVARPNSNEATAGEVQYLQSILAGYRQYRPRVNLQCSRDEPVGGTYMLRDRDTGEVVRTGRSNDLHRRDLEHRRSKLGVYEFLVDVRTDSYSQQRGREQVIHELLHPRLNRLAPISDRNPRFDFYKKTGGGKY